MSMTTAFYIVQTKRDWYRLHITKTHFCIGAGNDVQTLLNTVSKYVKEFKTEDEMLESLSKLEFGKPNKVTLNQYIKDYNNGSHLFSDLVSKTVKVAQEESRKSNPIYLSTRVVRTLISKNK